MASTAEVAGTVMIDGSPAERQIILIKDDPQGRTVIAEGTSSPDGSFTIQYANWQGSVIVLALDQYGENWTSNTTILEGSIVHPTIPNGFVYKASTSGTTGQDEPNWSLGETSVSIDGEISWIAKPFYRPVASGPIQGNINAVTLGPLPTEMIAFIASEQSQSDGLTVSNGNTVSNTNWYADVGLPFSDDVFYTWQVTIDTGDDHLFGITNELFTTDSYLGQNNVSTKDSIGNWTKGNIYRNLAAFAEGENFTVTTGSTVTIIFNPYQNIIKFYSGDLSKGELTGFTPSKENPVWYPAISCRGGGSATLIFDKSEFINPPSFLNTNYPNWKEVRGPIETSLKASGGITYEIDVSGVQYIVHEFLESGSFEVLNNELSVEYLIVGGGGSGGMWNCGGGGGGGSVKSGTATLTQGAKSIVVGNGAQNPAHDHSTLVVGSNGEDSSAFNIVAIGGGGGGRGWSGDSTEHNGLAGGNGGGGAGIWSASSIPTGGQGLDGGNSGGSGQIDANTEARAGGGGGGAGSPGGNASAANGGNGGIGAASSITGIERYYGGGGGGATNGNTKGNGGLGGGGDGGFGNGTPNWPTSGEANTGGGGGGMHDGGSAATQDDCGNGGSGIVVVRYPK